MRRLIAPPLISVIVPARNAEAFIDDCLESLVRQSFRRWECILVDDGSTDETVRRALAFEDPRIRLLRQANIGVSSARNNGLAIARADLVMFLDADDWLAKCALDLLFEEARRRPDSAVVFGPFLVVKSNRMAFPGQKPALKQRYPSGDVTIALLKQNFLANGGHVLARKDFAIAAGAFDERLRLSEDWEFWCRLSLRGQFHYVPAPEPIMFFRVDPSSASGSLSRNWVNHEPAISAIKENPAFEARFGPRRWRRLRHQIEASHLWEAGRVNFTYRAFPEARRLMVASLVRSLAPKRLALFMLAQLSQLIGHPLASRLRFRDLD